jgi:fructose-specific component phosphotransferase system IIB-like protein
MNRAVLSLCLFGAALATANILIMQRQTCPSETDVVAVFKETAPAVSTAKGKPAQAPKAAEKPVQAPKSKAANPALGKPEQISKAATTKPAAPPKGVDGTGSVNQK